MPFTNVYIKYIPGDWDEEKLKRFILSNCNVNITSCAFWNREFGVSACVNLESHEQAKEVIDKLNNIEVNSNNALHPKLYASRAMDRAERDVFLMSQKQKKGNERNYFAGLNLYVKNLPENVNDAMLKDMFSGFGKITSAKVMTDSITNKSRGFGFVCFERKEDGTRAMKEMDSKDVGGKQLSVSQSLSKGGVHQNWSIKRRSNFHQNTFTSNPVSSSSQQLYSTFPPRGSYGSVPVRQYSGHMVSSSPAHQYGSSSNVPKQQFQVPNQQFQPQQFQQFQQPMPPRPVYQPNQYNVSSRAISNTNQLVPIIPSQTIGSSMGVTGIQSSGVSQQGGTGVPRNNNYY